MDALLELIRKIRELPALYLGKISLERFSTFLDGYTFCLYEMGDKSNPDFFNDFRDYVQNYYGFISSTRGTDGMIIANSKNDEEAFYKYFELLDKFLEERSK